MGEDDVVGDWTMAPEMHQAMHLDAIQRALDIGDAVLAVLEAEELLEDHPNHAQGLLLLAEGLLLLGDAENAAETLDHFLQVSEPTADALALLAVARFDVCDLQTSMECSREAVRMEPESAEAHYYLGLALERLPGRSSEALQAFASAHQLDPARYPFPLNASEQDWKRMLSIAFTGLPPEIASFYDGIDVVFEGLPDLAELRASRPPISPTVSGMYSGEPDPEKDPWEVRPSQFRLFTDNLARFGSEQAIVTELVLLLEHEAADWLGDSWTGVEE